LAKASRKNPETRSDIDARAVEQAHRQDLEVVHALAAGGPYRAHAHQRHGLGDVVAAGAHGRRAPHRQAELAQVIAVVLQVRSRIRLADWKPMRARRWWSAGCARRR
jgi:hypothetical protein